MKTAKNERQSNGGSKTASDRGSRRVSVERNTSESRIKIALALDGTGRRRIKTPIPFLDHMLDLLAKHAFLDLKIDAAGDTHIDDHHTVEDIGIVLGDALKQALGKKEGIRRFGTASVPLDETLAQVTVDLSGRPYLVYNVKLPNRRIKACPRRGTLGGTPLRRGILFRLSPARADLDSWILRSDRGLGGKDSGGG